MTDEFHLLSVPQPPDGKLPWHEYAKLLMDGDDG